ncbi:MAG: hypothetical protein EOP04_23870 [Proteobacteria bacterium]|nr:MAG: hypothetical protein EOP04_23870 [Pseudomonadota bacterium]
MKKLLAPVLFTLSCSTTSLNASSSNAWKELETKVKGDCAQQYKTAVGQSGTSPSISLDVMGGQDIVAALLRYEVGKFKTVTHSICLYSKSQKKVLEFYEWNNFGDAKSFQALPKI